MLYGCDLRWWCSRKGVPEFAGIKLCEDGDASARYRDIYKVVVQRETHQILFDKAAVIGSGRNGGFQALNLAIQFGARMIALVGFDMRHGDDGAAHWHGSHGKGLHNPRERSLEEWRGHLDGQAARLRDMGVDVVNVSPSSALQAYPKMTMAAALERFEQCRSVSA